VLNLDLSSIVSWGSSALLGLRILNANAQVDTIIRNQIQLGYDQSLSGKVPQAAYAYNYLNIPQLRRAIYGAMNGDRSRVRDSELGIRGVRTP